MNRPTAQQQSSVIFREPGTAPATWAMGSLFEHLLGPGDAEGAVGVSLVTQPPGVASPLHRHTRESEAFYLLEGSMTYRAGDEVYRLSPGSFISLPLGVPHAFRITGDKPAQFLALTTPAGLLSLYDAVGMPAAERRLPGADGLSMDEEIPRWNELAGHFGLEVVGPPLPEE